MSALQLLPPLTEAEYEALKADIARHGVLVPLVYDQHGDLLDGHHRKRACGELAITSYPSEVVPCADDAERRTLARSLNCQRRHLTQEQRRALIADQLRDTPQWADNRIAGVVGVNHETVRGVRQELEATCEIRKFTELVGGDGKTRPARRPVVLAKNKREREAVVAALPDASELLKPTVTDARAVTKMARRVRWRRNGECAGDATIGRATLLLGDFAERGTEIADQSVDLVYTDPPYEAAFYDRWPGLGKLVARVLKPSAVAIFYSGILCFPYAFDGLREHLQYWAVGTLVHAGQHNKVNERKLFIGGKALLFMVRHDFTGPSHWIDNLATSPQPEKAFHEWQQSLKPAQDYIRGLTEPGDLVCDPCLGGGTFGVAALSLGRCFVGIEIDPAAMATAEARIREAQEVQA